jgi:haloacetate dehalogenase
MTNLPDLFPGFETRHVETSAGKLFARLGGRGAPLLLLHGFPQTHVMYHRIAPELAEHRSLVIADLPGYGASDAPAAAADHSPYVKRAMAAAMVDLMQKLGHQRFALVGHDRGGRVGYRLALDHPARVTRLSVLDIIPTWEMWAKMDAKRAQQVYHWTFLAQPAPLPETLIGNSADFFMDWIFSGRRWGTDKSAFDPRAVEHYRGNFIDPARIHAFCEDYRAGQSTDVAIDEADVKAGNKIACPVLALWGARGIPSRGESPLEIWRRWAANVEGKAIECGHFLPEENPQATLGALLPFLAKD